MLLLTLTQAVNLSTQSLLQSTSKSDTSAKCLNDALFAGKTFPSTKIGVAQCNFPNGLTPPLENISCLAADASTEHTCCQDVNALSVEDTKAWIQLNSNCGQ